MFNYSDFTCRNWAFIDKSLQKKIKKTKLVFAGCGLGSYVAELAVRLGFENLIIIDNDIVELSNLNRQSYNQENIEKKKTLSLAKSLKKINSNLNIEIINKKVKNYSELKKSLSKSEILVNTFDINDTYFELVKEFSPKKLAIMPFNVGYGSCTIAVDSSNCDNFINDFGDSKSDLEFLMNIFSSAKKLRLKIPDYLQKNLNNIIKDITKIQVNPQIGIASFVTAATVMTMIINYLENNKIKLYPNINYIDFKDLV